MSAIDIVAAPGSVGRQAVERGGGLTPRGAARTAGVGYVALFVLGIVANFVVIEGMVVAGDPAATAANVGRAPGLFRLGLVSFLVIVALDVVVAWALHVLLRAVDADRSLLTAWFRILHSVFLGVGLAFLYQADLLLSGAAHLAPGGREVAGAQAMLALETFSAMWLVGLACFGVHLVLLARLLVRSGAAHRALAVILAVAGVAYVVDTIAHTVLTDYEAVAGVLLAIVAIPSVLGEGWLGLWLLRRGFGRPVVDAEGRAARPGEPRRGRA